MYVSSTVRVFLGAACMHNASSTVHVDLGARVCMYPSSTTVLVFLRRPFVVA